MFKKKTNPKCVEKGACQHIKFISGKMACCPPPPAVLMIYNLVKFDYLNE